MEESASSFLYSVLAARYSILATVFLHFLCTPCAQFIRLPIIFFRSLLPVIKNMLLVQGCQIMSHHPSSVPFQETRRIKFPQLHQKY